MGRVSEGGLGVKVVQDGLELNILAAGAIRTVSVGQSTQ